MQRVDCFVALYLIQFHKKFTDELLAMTYSLIDREMGRNMTYLLFRQEHD